MWSAKLKGLLLVLSLLNMNLALAEIPKDASSGEIGRVDAESHQLLIGDGVMGLDPNARIHTNASQFSSINGLKAGMKVWFMSHYSKEAQRYYIDEIWEVDGGADSGKGTQ